jgi:hypothetical protein
LTTIRSPSDAVGKRRPKVVSQVGGAFESFIVAPTKISLVHVLALELADDERQQDAQRSIRQIRVAQAKRYSRSLLCASPRNSEHERRWLGELRQALRTQVMGSLTAFLEALANRLGDFERLGWLSNDVVSAGRAS